MTIRFPIRIVWAGDVTAAQKRAIRRNLERAIGFLNGDGRTGRCTPIEFELDLVEGGAPRPGHYTIDVNQVKNRNLTWFEASYIDNATKRGRLGTERAAGDLGTR